MRNAAVRQRLDNGQVRIRQLDVLADKGNRRLADGVQLALNHGLPLGQVTAQARQPQQLADFLVQPFLVQHQRHFIDGAGIQVLEHAISRQVAEQANLRAHFSGHFVFTAANKNVRADADAAEFLDGVLRGLRFQLTRRLQEGDEGNVNIQAVFKANFRAHLADSFKERLALNIANRAADFGNHHVRRVFLLGDKEDVALDFVGDVRDDLNRRTEVAALPLTVDNGLVDAAAGHVCRLRQGFVNKALVVTKVEVSFRAVVRHEHFAVLIRTHRTGVNVDIRVKFLRWKRADRGISADAPVTPP